jgi:hypothetical protein
MQNALNETVKACEQYLKSARANMFDATEALIAAGKSIPARREAKTLMGEILISIISLQSMLEEITKAEGQ